MYMVLGNEARSYEDMSYEVLRFTKESDAKRFCEACNIEAKRLIKQYQRQTRLNHSEFVSRLDPNFCAFTGDLYYFVKPVAPEGTEDVLERASMIIEEARQDVEDVLSAIQGNNEAYNYLTMASTAIVKGSRNRQAINDEITLSLNYFAS